MFVNVCYCARDCYQSDLIRRTVAAGRLRSTVVRDPFHRQQRSEVFLELIIPDPRSP